MCGGWLERLKQRSKKTQMVEFRVEMAFTCTQKGQYFTARPRQMCADSGRHIRSPMSNLSLKLALFHQSWIYMVGKSTLEKQTG